MRNHSRRFLFHIRRWNSLTSLYRQTSVFFCNRVFEFLAFAGTCCLLLLPCLQVSGFRGHLLPSLVTVPSSFWLPRAHVAFSCYRVFEFLAFAGTCCLLLLPCLRVSGFRGHMLPSLVTVSSSFWLSRAHVAFSCYRVFEFLAFAGTCSFLLLPCFRVSGFRGHMSAPLSFSFPH